MAYMEIASIAIRIMLAIRLYDQNLKGLEAKVFASMSLQSVKRLQLDQAAHWCVLWGSYSCPGLDGGLGAEKLVLPPPLLYLLFTNLHFDAYCCSCDTFCCEVSITSAWLFSKMHNKLLPPSFCECCCAHCRCVCGYSTASTRGCALDWLTAQSLVSCQFLTYSCIFFHLLAGNCSERLIDGTLKGL